MAMLRVASSKVVPNALRAIASGSITSAFSSSIDRKIQTPFIISHQFSTDAKKQIDHKLVKILKSAIKTTRLFVENTMPATPADFPFTIQDNPCESEITLTRELDGEKIDVLVHMPWTTPEECEDISDVSDTDTDTDTNDDDSSDNGSKDCSDNGEEEESDDAPSLELEVTISKENGKELAFEVSAFANEIKISTISVKEPTAESKRHQLLCFGPYFVEEKCDLDLALREFLEIRGIKETDFGFLYKYMLRKFKQHPTLALKKLRNFIKE